MRRPLPGSEEHVGREIAEWLGVILLLTIAFLALLQVIGPQLSAFAETYWNHVRALQH